MDQKPVLNVTPEKQYTSRKEFIKALGIAGMSAAVLAACKEKPFVAGDDIPVDTGAVNDPLPLVAGSTTDELGDPLTAYDNVISYNNFYEFTTDKEGVARLAKNYQTSPWEVKIGGLVENPQTLSIDDIRQRYPTEERIYRMRCVEGWSMIIPWQGFPLAALLEDVKPTADAKYVRFESIYDPKELPGQKNFFYPWPYIEGLRLDEANNDLAILATGLYGKDLLPQSGAPIRLVVPWKYGFKSIKSITKIDLVSEMPVSLWMDSAPKEYGFYANVNPGVDHPRWSQATERRIGDISRRASLLFNGYEKEVAYLYEGMDLTKFF
ncbi:MAG: protein-methionine-sulfoxide reductase catalytic subunit MsrP [Anaerolineales bacterium]|nr:protein-methionine-sulfoxide reductase catalytic subunit MsrP [Anaerolineales bacterium]